MKEDEMGESIISQRLRRLREEGDAKDIPFYVGAEPMPMPSSGQGHRPKNFIPMEIEQARVNDTGDIEVFTSSAVADANAGPFENIAHRGWIQRRDEDEGVGPLRIKAGLRLRSLYEGAQVSPLKGQNYESGGGGRGGVPAPVGDQALDCIRKLGELRDVVPEEVFGATVDVVCKDVWIWEGKKGGAISKEVDRVLCGLDHMACYLGFLTAEEVRLRWPKPAVRPSAKPASRNAPAAA